MSQISPQSLGIRTEKPEYPQYASLETRKQSFDNDTWRQQNCPVSAEQLAIAGFVCAGKLITKLCLKTL